MLLRQVRTNRFGCQSSTFWTCTIPLLKAQPRTLREKNLGDRPSNGKLVRTPLLSRRPFPLGGLDGPTGTAANSSDRAAIHSLYNATGTPIRISPRGAADTYVGQELDLLYQIIVNPRADVLFGYSHFFAGTFVKNTNPADVSGNADFYYSQWTWRF